MRPRSACFCPVVSLTLSTVYHYHSIYDSADWMDTFGDSTFERHVVVAKVLGLATLRLADSMILPINVTGSSLSQLPSFPTH